MRSSVIALIVCTSLGYAQDSQSPRPDAAKPGKTEAPGSNAIVRRLETVTWNPRTAELSWVVSAWDVAAGADQPPVKESYTIQVETAVMKLNGEGRHFDADEARQVRLLMDIISTYAVESTVWWGTGEGGKVDGNVIPAPDGGSHEKGKENQTKPSPKPAPVVLHGPVAARSLSEPSTPVASSH